MNSVEILGVRVDDVTMDQAVERIADMVRAPRCCQIATVNPEFIMVARRNPNFARALAESDLNLPDGANLVRAARLLGHPIHERVAGSDLIWRLAARAADEGWKVYLLGAREGVGSRAATRLCRRYPLLRIAGVFPGSPDPQNDNDQINRVNAAAADVLLVAYGAPAQDLWIARNRPRLSAHAAMGVGGAFDFIAGQVSRAPQWMQRAGLEWLFRVVRQPWRVKRQLALLEFAWLVFRAMRKK